MAGNVKLTVFQRNKIMRDKKIASEYKKMKGSSWAKVDALARKYRLTVNTIYVILRSADMHI